MKMNKLITTAALALAGAAFFQTAANAQATTGDLILGFQTASPNMGSSSDLETNLGLYTNFTGLSNGTTVYLTDGDVTPGQTGAFSITDLDNTYGSTPASLRFDVSGTLGAGPGNDEVFITQASGSGPSSDPTNPSETGIDALYNGFSGTAGTTGSTDLIVTASNAGSYKSNAGTSGNFGQFSSSHTQSTYSATGTEVFDLYDAPITSAGSVTEVGYFTLYGANDGAKSGDLTFTSTEPVAAPEPSTYALFGLGALVMIIAVRRRGVLRT